MRCHNCGQQSRNLCPDHLVCYPCHDVLIDDLFDEVGRSVVFAQHQSEAQVPPSKERTLGSRIIGGMWEPQNPTDALRDDLPALYRSLEKFLQGGDNAPIRG